MFSVPRASTLWSLTLYSSARRDVRGAPSASSAVSFAACRGFTWDGCSVEGSSPSVRASSSWAVCWAAAEVSWNSIRGEFTGEGSASSSSDAVLSASWTEGVSFGSNGSSSSRGESAIVAASAGIFAAVSTDEAVVMSGASTLAPSIRSPSYTNGWALSSSAASAALRRRLGGSSPPIMSSAEVRVAASDFCSCTAIPSGGVGRGIISSAPAPLRVGPCRCCRSPVSACSF